MLYFIVSTVYTVFSKSFASEQLIKPIIVKNGFNLWAFLFTILWTMYRGLWQISVIIMSLYLALLLATKYGYIPLHFKVLCWPLVSLYIAYNSGYLIETDLESRGYQIVDLVITSSIEEAKGIYLQRVSIGQVVANNIDCD